MSSAHDHQVLIQYLLGSLPEAETERLDQLSIADDEFVSHLSAAENDLVDTYVRGELSGEALQRFKTHYLSSRRRRDKVEFADTLRLLEERAATSPAPSTIATPTQRFSWRFLPAPRLVQAWALAGAALLLLLPAGYLLLANGRLRRELTQAQSQRASLESRAQDLLRQLEQQRPVNTGTPREIKVGGIAQATIERLQIVSLLLLPQRRGPGEVATVSVPPGTDVVALQLQLESDEFPQYEVSLKDAATNRVLWHSGKLKSAFAGENKSVTMSLPAALLSPGHFSVELSSIAAKGPAELLTSYAFRVVVR